MQIVPLYIIETLISIRLFLPNILGIILFHTLFVEENPKDLLISNRIIPNISMDNHIYFFIYRPKYQPYVDILTKELEKHQK